jgi:hypothetical protein
MGVLEDLNTELRAYLSLQWVLAEKHGQDINVGEDFTMTFVITNVAPKSLPWVRFTDVWLRVDATPFARPRDSADGIFVVDLPETNLDPGDQTAADVIFRATTDMGSTDLGGWLADIFQEETIFQAWVHARVDPGLLFTVDLSRQGHHEIVRT